MNSNLGIAIGGGKAFSVSYATILILFAIIFMAGLFYSETNMKSTKKNQVI